MASASVGSPIFGVPVLCGALLWQLRLPRTGTGFPRSRVDPCVLGPPAVSAGDHLISKAEFWKVCSWSSGVCHPPDFDGEIQKVSGHGHKGPCIPCVRRSCPGPHAMKDLPTPVGPVMRTLRAGSNHLVFIRSSIVCLFKLRG